MGNRRRELLDAQAGVYRYDQLIVLKDTRMPAVLLEAGSIVNRDEELLLATPERQALDRRGGGRGGRRVLCGAAAAKADAGGRGGEEKDLMKGCAGLTSPRKWGEGAGTEFAASFRISSSISAP